MRAKAKSSTNDLRKEPRLPVRRPGWITLARGMPLIECTVWDESANGARLELKGPEPVPDEFYLYFSLEIMSRRRCRVAWRSDGQIGVAFMDETPPESGAGADRTKP